jgi:hypothetical protein
MVLFLRKLWNRLRGRSSFVTSSNYWESRYQSGGTSGDGSYNALANYKAEIINGLVKEHQIDSVIDWGCGDGNQLTYFQFKNYLGIDVSSTALKLCRQRFAKEESKRFILESEYRGQTAELALSLDVIYHLIEDAVFEQYMQRLFHSAARFVLIYASDKEGPPIPEAPHFRERSFSEYCKKNFPEFRLLRHIPNRYPYNGNGKETSISDFYLFQRAVED